jgi:hypothetical protein
MPYIKTISDEMISAMQEICSKAFAVKEFLRINAGSHSEALRLRQQIYSARRALKKINPQDTSPLSSVEMRIENTELHIMRPGAMLQKFQIFDGFSSEKVEIELGKNTLEVFSEDQIFEMSLIIAEIRGPGDHEEEAKDLLRRNISAKEFKEQNILGNFTSKR